MTPQMSSDSHGKPREFEVALESTAFPTDRLVVRRLTGRERISELFSFDVEIICADPIGPSAKEMVGSPVVLAVSRHADERGSWSGTRRIEGMIAEVDDLFSTREGHRVHRLHIVPNAFWATMVQTQDIFVEMSVPQIIEKKLAACDIKATQKLLGKYPPREFVVQYKETDLAFVSRLAEHLGISFHFENGESGTTLTWTDHADGFPWIEGAETIAFDVSGAKEDVFALSEKRRVIPGYYAVGDYNYRKPHIDLTSEHELASGFGGGVIEYGTHVRDPEEAKNLARVRAEEAQARQHAWQGESDLPVLTAGSRFKLEGHPDLPTQALLLVEVTHEFNAVTAVDVDPGSPEKSNYVVSFTAVAAETTYRPPRTTPRPRIAGLLNAIVEDGGSGATKFAQIDDAGRYRVRFLFDTGSDAKATSGPVRMLQNHVGENYGTFPTASRYGGRGRVHRRRSGSADHRRRRSKPVATLTRHECAPRRSPHQDRDRDHDRHGRGRLSHIIAAEVFFARGRVSSRSPMEPSWPARRARSSGSRARRSASRKRSSSAASSPSTERTRRRSRRSDSNGHLRRSSPCSTTTDGTTSISTASDVRHRRPCATSHRGRNPLGDRPRGRCSRRTSLSATERQSRLDPRRAPKASGGSGCRSRGRRAPRGGWSVVGPRTIDAASRVERSVAPGHDRALHECGRRRSRLRPLKFVRPPTEAALFS